MRDPDSNKGWKAPEECPWRLFSNPTYMHTHIHLQTCTLMCINSPKYLRERPGKSNVCRACEIIEIISLVTTLVLDDPVAQLSCVPIL